DLIEAVHGDGAPAARAPTRAGETAEHEDAPAPKGQSWRTIRVPLDLLDDIMNGVSDMVLARNEVARKLRSAGNASGVTGAFDRLSNSIAEMRATAGKMRMQRLNKLFAPLPRLVRDLGQELGKRVDVVVDGGEVELDREMIESIRDPLTHIVRNAIDHGIETPDKRRAAGKPENGTLHISARQSGNQIVIDVSDDGTGISIDRLVAKAVADKVISAAAARDLSAERKLDLIFSPGLTTSSEVTSISGRGVGMDVVRSNIERIGGVVDLHNRQGAGLTITLRVPLTLTIISGLTVLAGDQTFAIPRLSVDEIVLQSSDSVRIDHNGGLDLAILRGERLSLVYLEDSLGMPRAATGDEDRTLIVTRETGGNRYALSVADVYDHEELVIKPATPLIMATGLYAGTTLPDSGKPMLLLDTTGIAAKAAVGRSIAAPIKDDPVDYQRARQALSFREFDGSVRTILLSFVQRIEDVAIAAMSRAGGRLLAVIDDRMLPLYDCAIPADRTHVKVLRIRVNDRELGYVIDDVVDLVDLPYSFEPARKGGIVSLVGMIDGQPIEIVEPDHLAAAVFEAAVDNRPTCRIAGVDNHWTHQFLRPILESAGYRVLGVGDPGAAAIVLAAGDDVAAADGKASIVCLRDSPAGDDDGSVYWHDPDGILAALKRIEDAA
ncbi:MAG: chemotaxis protein CheA, partial [Sphingomonadales bacterium]|nr:chemotaxis protein CheA [Sphingomonadales bacterium]